VSHKLPQSMRGWQGWYDNLCREISKKGKITGAEVDAWNRTQPDTLTCWAGSQDIGDILVAPGCAHIYRIHRIVDAGLLRRRICGNGAEKVFYYLPEGRSLL
jgi:hypothetical protein